MKRWTQNEKVLLLALIQQGLKPKEIAEKMDGRTTSAVFNQIYGSKAAHVHYQGNKHKRDYIRAVRKVPAEKIPTKTPTPAPAPMQEQATTLDTTGIAAIVSAAFSIATFILVLGALLA
tara:strand:- start:2708 stop:3064 length:357 start_codon:yes stop_codon:yes gene_type:complete